LKLLRSQEEKRPEELQKKMEEHNYGFFG